jgi:hypothetical protein
MGYDISIIKQCTCGEHTETLYSTGDTFNMAPVYQIIFDCELGIKMLDGFTLSEVGHALNFAINNMRKMKNELIPLNPSNGWGSYDDTLKMLIELKSECDKYSHDENHKIEIGW